MHVRSPHSIKPPVKMSYGAHVLCLCAYKRNLGGPCGVSAAMWMEAGDNWAEVWAGTAEPLLVSVGCPH